MMKHARCVAAILVAIAAVPQSGWAEDKPHVAIQQEAGELTISSPWMRQPPPGAKVGGGYVVISNTGGEHDRLVAAEAPFAERTEIHEMKMEGGTMIMTPLNDGLALPAGETVTLAPGGFHIMFMGLTQTPQVGEMVPVSLRFEKAGDVTLDFHVAPIGATAAPHAGH